MTMGSACAGDQKSDTDTGAPPTTELCDPATHPLDPVAQDNGSGCSVLFQLEDSDCAYATVQGFVIQGADPAPTSAVVVMPDICDPAGASGGNQLSFTGTGAGDEWSLSAAANADCTPTSTWNTTTGSPECNTYPSTEHGADGVYELRLPYPPGGADCDVYYEDVDAWTLTPIDASNPCGTNASLVPGGQGCTARTGVPMDFVYQRVFDLDGDGTQHARMLPILESGAGYSERAWLRKVVVTDWGDASEFFVTGFGEPFVVSSSDVIDGAHSLALSSGNTPKTFAVGAVTMDAIWSIDGLDAADVFFDLPKVEVDWSCEVDSGEPHFVNDGAPQAYAKALGTLGITGVSQSQKLILRFANDHEASLELEGRYRDRVGFPIVKQSTGVYTFEVDTVARLGATLSGTITTSGTNRVVAFDELVIQGTDLGTPTWTFAEYP